MIIIDVYQRLYCISKWRHLFNYLENRTYEISYCFYTTKVMLLEMAKITKLPKWLQKVAFTITLIEITKIAKNPYYNITWQYLKLHIVRPLMTYLLAKSITSCKAVLSLGSFSLKVLTKETVMTPGYKFDVQTSVFILFLQGHPLYISLSAFENRLWEYIRN